MADEAYRAVFLRVHPTGKMVLSLTTGPDGHETEYARQVADELGVPELDVKVVPADEDRFGVGHGYNTAPSPGTSDAITTATAKILAKAKLLAGAALDTDPGGLKFRRGAFCADGDGNRREPDDRRSGHVRARDRGPSPRRRGRSGRPGRVPRLMALRAGTYVLGPEQGRLSVHTGKTGAASKAGHNLDIEVGRWSAHSSSPRVGAVAAS